MNSKSLRDGEKRMLYFISAIQDYDVNKGDLETAYQIIQKSKIFGSKIFSHPKKILTKEEYEIFDRCMRKIQNI